MAEILVKAVDATNATDAAKDARGCYKRGMPVVVMDDGHRWGRAEGLPAFVIVRFAGVPSAKLQEYVQHGEAFGRRLWQFRLDDLPRAHADALKTGTLDATWDDLKGFLRNRETGLDETRDINSADVRL